jgi:alkanesulfonate monooxygenase SsuD/methylene tetrahydromethanopterin reductase-like flavin-dependent oxidoreductase (luciferase family)
VREAVGAYRDAFRPGRLAEPRVIVSVDVLVADSEAEATRLAEGYAHWVHSIRAGQGAIVYPTPDEASAQPLDAAALAVVRDRLATRFVGTPEQVAEQLEALQRVTGADELLITTITHDPRDRERSVELLAETWGLAGAPTPATVGAHA